jgi:hypothetical protein
MIDAYELAMLSRDKPLTIHENASGFTCVICGCEQPAWCYRVTLPQGKGKACVGCAADHRWKVR